MPTVLVSPVKAEPPVTPLTDAVTETLVLVLPLPLAELGPTMAASTTALIPAAAMTRRTPRRDAVEVLVIIVDVLSVVGGAQMPSARRRS
jgi:hypothetical protein